MRPRGRDDGGVSSIELAIIAPTLLALIFITIQAALFFYGRSVALQAAREGVSQLRLQESATACQANQSVVESATAKYASEVGSGALNAPVAKSACDYSDLGNSTVSVEVKGHAISLLGFTLTIDEKAKGRAEQFQNFP